MLILWVEGVVRNQQGVATTVLHFTSLRGGWDLRFLLTLCFPVFMGTGCSPQSDPKDGILGSVCGALYGMALHCFVRKPSGH